MSFIVYAVRSPLQTISHSLYPLESSAVVVSLENPRVPGIVLRTTPSVKFTEGEKLSYEQLLAIFLESDKVVTL